MSSDVKWVYRNGKLKEKVTTRQGTSGSKEVIRQKAQNTLFGRAASAITSRTKFVK